MAKETEVSKINNQSLLVEMAQKYRVSPDNLYSTVKNTLMRPSKGGQPVSDDALMAFMIVAHRYDLDPFLNQLVAFEKAGAVKPMVPIDGWIAIANRQPNYDGHEFTHVHDDHGKVIAVECKIHIKGRSRPSTTTEWMEECYDGTKGPWKKWPIRMLQHKAYAQAVRYAFGISGLYDPDEADRIMEGEIIEERKMISAPVAKDVPETHEGAPEEIQVPETPDSEGEPEEAPESEEMEMTEESYRERGADG